MPKKLPTIYVAVHDDVWAIERAEFRASLLARSQGITDDEGDLNRMGHLLRHKMSSHPRHDITWWTPEDYRDCLLAMNG